MAAVVRPLFGVAALVALALPAALPSSAPAAAAPARVRQQVQLDVVVARVQVGLWRAWSRDTLKDWQRACSQVHRDGAAYAGRLDLLKALAQNSTGQLVAQPRLVTLSGQQASFLDGGERAVIVQAGFVQFEEFGVRLDMLPTVRPNGAVRLEVTPKITTQDARGSWKRQMRVTAEVEGGQVLEIIGPAHQADGLGEVDLIVLVRPHIVAPIPCDRVDRACEPR